VVLYGSMTDPGQLLVSDADLAVWADRRADAAFLAGLRELGPALGMDVHRAEEAQAALDRFRLEALLAADDERIDVSVTDGWSDTISAVPAGATEIELFPPLVTRLVRLLLFHCNAGRPEARQDRPGPVLPATG
jgi:hypothetical protein